ncbi:hypothetical protein GUITHDRAFT_100718 [Guillardia theta CCMP2712]|uniref:Collagen-like protein n=1 Tax=Guillardia theta (strain CCMP2712) TaxID=905079 RepID=L1JZG4_GUITC|nr:hypothetical protein GUITHDRAFT_100718 [Guillardia theta CCMP2712]EKX53747.1 hypothetical protein GUITHDRAFT_100718 [Guillardia theta CCMP2712]|eukprot:XP_005840727.1 hypothetical protein GUITHDRAFT_100718 [Guillardia theta CCMP2712]
MLKGHAVMADRLWMPAAAGATLVLMVMTGLAGWTSERRIEAQGSFKCFVVDGKAKCLPKQRMLANEKQEAKVTISAARLSKVLERAKENRRIADELLRTEGLEGLQRNQKRIAELAAAKIRGMNRMLGALEASNEGVVRELGDPGPSGRDGPPGPPGPHGLQGTEGKEGEEGDEGPEGKEGAPDLTLLQAGPAGPQGMPGLPARIMSWR